MSADGVLIVGGGLAAQRCAEALRARGYEGKIRVACAEPEPPYDRPPLSKGLLAGTVDDGEISFRPPDWYRDNAVELLLGQRARSLDPRARRVELDDGGWIGYEKLLIATGSRPRTLPFLERFENVHALRTVADARRLRAELGTGSRLAVIGAGFIGQEVAATARGLGAEVTMVESLALPLARVLGPLVGRWFVELHESQGVDVIASARISSASGNGRVERLSLADGRTLECETVVVGIGVLPAAEWLADSELGADGILTDACARSRLPDVFAAGDVSRPFDARYGVHARSEHWDAAARQGPAAARAMLGLAAGESALPSFWSDQYGLRMQYVGNTEHADGFQLEGDPGESDFAVTYTRGELPVAAFTVGRPGALVRLREQIERRHETSDTSKKARER